MIENNKIIINTSESFEIIRLINKLQLGDVIKNKIFAFQKLKMEKDNLNYILIKKINESTNKQYEEIEDKENVIKKVLFENVDLNEKINEVDSKIATISTESIFELIEHIPLAEKEFYRLLSKITETDIKEIEKQTIDKTLMQIKEILASDTLTSLLSFFN